MAAGSRPVRCRDIQAACANHSTASTSTATVSPATSAGLTAPSATKNANIATTPRTSSQKVSLRTASIRAVRGLRPGISARSYTASWALSAPDDAQDEQQRDVAADHWDGALEHGLPAGVGELQDLRRGPRPRRGGARDVRLRRLRGGERAAAGGRGA